MPCGSSLLKKIPAVVLVAFVVLFHASCSKSPQSLSSTKGPVLAGARVEKVRDLVVDLVINSPGTIVPFDKVNIASKIDGRIQKVYVKEGQRVRKGQILVELEKLQLLISLKEAKAQLLAAQANLELAQARYKEAVKGVVKQMRIIEKAEANYQEKKARYEYMKRVVKRKEHLYKIGGISQEEWETAQTQLEAARTEMVLAEKELNLQKVGYTLEDLKSAGFTNIPKEVLKAPNSERRKLLMKYFIELNTATEKASVKVAEANVDKARANLENLQTLLKQATIRSPIDGVVAQVNVFAGEQVKAKDTLMIIVTPDPIYARLDVPEGFQGKVHVGYTAKISVPALNSTFKGPVDVVQPLVDPQSKSFAVKVKLRNPRGLLMPGMFLTGQIFTPFKERVLAVPVKSIFSEGERNYVFVVKKGILLRREVVMGRKLTKDLIEVKAGLERDDKILVEPVEKAVEGMRVILRGPEVFCSASALRWLLCW